MTSPLYILAFRGGGAAWYPLYCEFYIQNCLYALFGRKFTILTLLILPTRTCPSSFSSQQTWSLSLPFPPFIFHLYGKLYLPSLRRRAVATRQLPLLTSPPIHTKPGPSFTLPSLSSSDYLELTWFFFLLSHHPTLNLVRLPPFPLYLPPPIYSKLGPSSSSPTNLH